MFSDPKVMVEMGVGRGGGGSAWPATGDLGDRGDAVRQVADRWEKVGKGVEMIRGKTSTTNKPAS